jgi:hypothetical protein
VVSESAVGDSRGSEKWVGVQAGRRACSPICFEVLPFIWPVEDFLEVTISRNSKCKIEGEI